MATTIDWIKEAEEQAKKYSDAIKASNQYLIDQLNQSKQNTLNQLQEQQNNAIYNLNSNKVGINQNAIDNAKQLNVAKLMALKSNQEAMNRAGLGTQGIVGSQVNAINNDYGNNLTSVLDQKASDLRELEKEKNNTLLAYNTNRLNLENEYGNNLANLQQAISDKALSQYNTVYANYLAQKQQEYENEQAELARQEAIRQFNEQMNYQKEQDKIANAQRWSQINAQNNNNNKVEFDDEKVEKEELYDSKTYETLKKEIDSAPKNYFSQEELNNAKATYSLKIQEALDNGLISEMQADMLLNIIEQMKYLQNATKADRSNLYQGGKNNVFSTPYNQVTKDTPWAILTGPTKSGWTL